MKKISVLFAVVSILFTSCFWSNNDDLILPGMQSITISGKIQTNGAMPADFSKFFSESSRSAAASLPTGNTIEYRVDLLATEDATTAMAGATSTINDDGAGNITYIIKYVGIIEEQQDYWLRAVAYYTSVSEIVEIMQSPATQITTSLKAGTFSQDLELRPIQEGNGTVALPITIDTSEITSATIVSADGLTLDTSTLSSGTVTIRHLGTGIASGNYSFTVNFYKTIGGIQFLLYQFDDSLNVSKNLLTDTWVKNGTAEHLTTNGSGATICKITDALLDSFKTTNFYVDNRLAAIGEGTFIKPYNSLITAISRINGIGNNTTTYTIHIKGDNSGSIKEQYSFKYTINKRITLESYIDVPGSKDGIFCIEQSSSDYGTIFEVQDGGVLTFDSNGQDAGISGSHATKGIMIKANDTSVDVMSGGKFIMKGGRITASDPDNSEGRLYLHQPNAGAQTVFEMSGGAIEGFMFPSINSVLIETGATLKLYGKPYIYNSVNNVYLPNSTKIKIAGTLQSGARIGVTTQTPPTLDTTVPVTEDYGYQSGGYHAGINPATFFYGDKYGISTTASGEVALAASGGTLTEKYSDTVAISFEGPFTIWTGTAATQNISVTKNGTAVASPTLSLVSLEAYGSNYNTSTYYELEDSVLTLKNTLLEGKYTATVSTVFDGITYSGSKTFTVVPKEVSVSSGNFNSSMATDLSEVFKSGRNSVANIKPLIVSTHEVTQKEYELYCTYADSEPSAAKGKSDDNHDYPVYFVSWYDAVMYCNLKTLNDPAFGSTPEQRLSHCAYYLAGSDGSEVPNGRLIATWRDAAGGDSVIKATVVAGVTKYCYAADTLTTELDYSDSGSGDADGGIRFDENADGWRLPTEAEWEYLARGGNLTTTGQTDYSGSNVCGEVGWYEENSDETTHEVCTKAPNGLGLYDMTGNVNEWCWDWNESVSYLTGATGNSYGDTRVERGGGFSSNTTYCAVSNRSGSSQWGRFPYQGFRVVRNAQ